MKKIIIFALLATLMAASNSEACTKKNKKEAESACANALTLKDSDGDPRYTECKVCDGCSIGPKWAVYQKTGLTCMAVVHQNEQKAADKEAADNKCKEIDAKKLYPKCVVEKGLICNSEKNLVVLEKHGRFRVCVPKPDIDKGDEKRKFKECLSHDENAVQYMCNSSITKKYWPNAKMTASKIAGVIPFKGCSGPYDKYMHCSVSCITAMRCGRLASTIKTLGKELSDLLDHHQDNAFNGDSVANRTGRKLSRSCASEDDCLTQCKSNFPN